jgi:excinuclease ABC subunit B
MYGDRITKAMNTAIEETSRRRAIQIKYNDEHGITPATIQSAIKDAFSAASGAADYYSIPKARSGEKSRKDSEVAKNAAAAKNQTGTKSQPPKKSSQPAPLTADLIERIEEVRSQMFTAAENLEFETAARLRDQLNRLQSGEMVSEAPGPPDLSEGGGPGDKSGKKKSGLALKPGALSRKPRSAQSG